MSSADHVAKSSRTFVDANMLRASIKGLASAGFFMAFFGAAWWGWGIGGIRGVFRGEIVAYFVILASATIVLVCGGVLLLRTASRLPQDTTDRGKMHDATEGKRYGTLFGLVFGLEMVTIAVGSRLLNVFHYPEFVMPFVAIVVGVHFFPLARLFHVHLYSVTGTLLVLTSVTVVFAVPIQTQIENLLAWNALVGVFCAAILWLTGLYALLQGRSFLTQARGW